MRKGQIPLPLFTGADPRLPARAVSPLPAGTVASKPDTTDKNAPSWLQALREREAVLWETLADTSRSFTQTHLSNQSICVQADARDWLQQLPDNTLHAGLDHNFDQNPVVR